MKRIKYCVVIGGLFVVSAYLSSVFADREFGGYVSVGAPPESEDPDIETNLTPVPPPENAENDLTVHMQAEF